ncbi:MAG TPA: hypothetical protein VN259_04560 [Xanthomonadales bacterium]|nr:hypothetical protein [Xanthomonadales bacterium]
MGSQSTNFSSPLAAVMFGSAPPAELAALEHQFVEGVEQLLANSTSMQIHRLAPSIDHDILRHLSGRNFLHVARLIERRAPAAIENAPRLHRERKELIKGAELERIFAPASLNLLIEALRADEQLPEGGL